MSGPALSGFDSAAKTVKRVSGATGNYAGWQHNVDEISGRRSAGTGAFRFYAERRD